MKSLTKKILGFLKGVAILTGIFVAAMLTLLAMHR